METTANTPPPIKTWWYPGKAIGYEFIYPRSQALQLAKVTSEPVLTTIAESQTSRKPTWRASPPRVLPRRSS
jgi:hypothetical protein